jgi:hypothetical protein
MPTTSKPVLDPFNTEHYDDLYDAQRPSVGVRDSSMKLLTYELVVIASDIGDVVRSAGGWMCDRVRAGWRVTVLIPGDSEIRPLNILGVRALPFENEYQVMSTSSVAAFAVASEVIERDERVRRDIQSALMRGRAEITFWGKPSPHDLDCRLARTRHRLSGAARAFKTQALIATPSASPVVAPAEEFRSAAMWYPPNGTDLAPIL